VIYYEVLGVVGVCFIIYMVLEGMQKHEEQEVMFIAF
jgi:hypothetical protein